jgi:hypothetical protein
MDRTLMDDGEVIEVLKRVALQAPTHGRLDIDELLARGRRARRHRRTFLTPAATLTILGAAALVFATTHLRSTERDVFLPPAGLAAEQSQLSNTQSASNGQVLREALGDDFVIDSEKTNPGGNVTLRPGSSSAEGLPTGVTVYTQILALQQNPMSGELTQFCRPMEEKNLIVSACTKQVLPSGQTVFVQHSRIGPGGVKLVGFPEVLTGDGVRVLFEQPDETLVIVDLSTQENESVSTPESRAAARAWLNEMTPRLVTAATDSRVQDDTCDLEPAEKRGRNNSKGVWRTWVASVKVVYEATASSDLISHRRG